ncbi:MAG: hypothetical protein ACNA8K_07375 [Cyclonatronaceae bacterium]
MKNLSAIVFIFFFLFLAEQLHAQIPEAFREPVIRKVETSERANFQRRFSDIIWTGMGMQGVTTIDQLPTSELRARFQALFGNPTQTIEHLISKPEFRAAECIQFEYWFVVNDSIPVMILDVDGPFTSGLVYGVASRYIDVMPGIKRALSNKMIGVRDLGEYTDFFYSPERNEWYEVSFRDGRFGNRKIDHPARFPRINF